MQTQWRMGPSKAVGLDYNVLPMVMRLHGVKRKDQAELFDSIRVMETEALSIMYSED